MSQLIYLIRHGKPELPGNGHCCIGRGSDPVLSDIGKKQALAWADSFTDAPVIWCSSLKRSRETADIMAQGRVPVQEAAGLTEIDVGEWEGLSFYDIRARYQDLYDQRGVDWAIPPAGGETLDVAADRIEQSLLALVRQSEGDVVAVGHEGSIRALVWRLLQLDTTFDARFSQPYGSLTVVKYANGSLAVTATGKLPDDVPTDEEIEDMWNYFDTPESVRSHSQVVCEKCRYLFELLRDAGYVTPWGVLRAAALLHDACRTAGHRHPVLAAAYLRERGYVKTARLIENHHNPAVFHDRIDSGDILFLADKLIQGDKNVTLKRRFAASAKKCTTQEAKAHHQQQFETAVRIRDTIAGIVKRKRSVVL